MRFAYSRDANHPALRLTAFVRGLANSRRSRVTAKIDTGADVTVIPDSLRETLNLKPSGYLRCLGAFDSQPQLLPTYFIELSIDERLFLPLEVLSRPRNLLLLGRDFLNQFVLVANGPDQFFEIHKPESN